MSSPEHDRAMQVHRVLTDMYVGTERAIAEKMLRANNALRDVLAVHAPYVHGEGGRTYVGCCECGDYDDPVSLDYPCGTVTAIAEAYGLTAAPNSVVLGGAAPG